MVVVALLSSLSMCLDDLWLNRVIVANEALYFKLGSFDLCHNYTICELGSARARRAMAVADWKKRISLLSWALFLAVPSPARSPALPPPSLRGVRLPPLPSPGTTSAVEQREIMETNAAIATKLERNGKTAAITLSHLTWGESHIDIRLVSVCGIKCLKNTHRQIVYK